MEFLKIRPITLMLAVLFTLASSFSYAELSTANLIKLDCPDRVADVAFSPDGSLLAAGYGWNKEGGVKVWHLPERSVVVSLLRGTGERDDVRRVAFSPDGKYFAAANWDGDVALWSVGSWESPRKVLLRRGSPVSLGFSPDSTQIVLVSEGGVDVFDLRMSRAKALVRKRSKFVGGSFGGATFARDGSALIICRDHAIQFWNLTTNKPDKNWNSEWTGFFCEISAKGDHLLTGGAGIGGGKSVIVWNADGTRLANMTAFRSGIFSAASSHSGDMFALAGGGYGDGGDLSLWRFDDRHQVGYISIGEFPIQSVAFSPDDKALALGSDDGYVALVPIGEVHGPEKREQTTTLCGEVHIRGNSTFILPLSKVPPPMRRNFEYAWELPVVNGQEISEFDGFPIVVSKWELESDAQMDKVRLSNFLVPSRRRTSETISNYVVFGDIENPGWNKGFVVKVYGDSSYVAATNMGQCINYGSSLNTPSAPSFEALKTRLVQAGLLSIPRFPLTLGIDHYRTRFIELSVDKSSELRTDGEIVDFSKSANYPTEKQKDLRRIFEAEEPLLKSLKDRETH